jgi:hypothetical protein
LPGFIGSSVTALINAVLPLGRGFGVALILRCLGDRSAAEPTTLAVRCAMMSLLGFDHPPDRTRDDQGEPGSADTYRLTCDDVARREGTRTPNRQIRSLPAIVHLVGCGPSVLLTSQNLVFLVRLLACRPSVGLSSSVKNSVNDGLHGVEHQTRNLVLRTSPCERVGGTAMPTCAFPARWTPETAK